MSKLDGLTKAKVIARIVANGIASKTWRSSTETEALGCLSKNERTTRKGDVLAFVKTAYDAAGAGYSGRWQS